MRERLLSLLADGRDIVVDSSFWQRSQRYEYKRLIEQAGGCWRLLYLKADPNLLRCRLDARAERFDANSPFPITVERLNYYLQVFEPPSGEGEQVNIASDDRPQHHTTAPDPDTCSGVGHVGGA